MKITDPTDNGHLRRVRVGALMYAAVFLLLGIFFALGQPRGFTGGIHNILAGSQDLLLRYNEVNLLMLGENIYQRALQDDLILQQTSKVRAPGVPRGADYFPSTLLPVLLISWLPFPVVQVLWLILNLASAVVFVQCLRWVMDFHSPSGPNQALMVSLWICGIPFWSGLAMGQSSIFSMALTLAAFRADFTGRPWLAGLLLALGVFKYPVIWPLVLFLFILPWRWRSLLLAGGIHFVLHLALCHRVNAHPFTLFTDVLRGNAWVFNLNSPLTVWMPFRAWNRFFPDFPVPVNLLGSLLLLGMVAGLIWLWRKRNKESRHNLLLWIAALALLAVLSVSSKIFAHMYALPVLLWACAPSASAITQFQRGRLITYVLYLSYVPGGLGNLGLPGLAMYLLSLLYNVVLAALAIELGLLLYKLERSPRRQRAPG